jgi:DNA-binding transcriptional MerR regulator
LILTVKRNTVIIDSSVGEDQQVSGERYSIGELAAAAGVTPRTIRFYTAEGLLPPPETRGRYASYGPAYLDRLRLIGRLKAAYLPLSEIRARLASMSDAEVRAALAEDAPADSAAAYLARVLAPPAAPRAVAEAPAPYGAHMALPVGAPRAALSLGRAVAQDAAAATEDGERWRRVPLADGVELHIREPQPPRQAARVQQVIEQARALLFDDVRASEERQR